MRNPGVEALCSRSTAAQVSKDSEDKVWLCLAKSWIFQTQIEIAGDGALDCRFETSNILGDRSPSRHSETLRRSTLTTRTLRLAQRASFLTL
jgi:hypothetical protein